MHGLTVRETCMWKIREYEMSLGNVHMKNKRWEDREMEHRTHPN